MLFASQRDIKQTNGIAHRMNGHGMGDQMNSHAQINGHGMNGQMNGHAQLNEHSMNGQMNAHCMNGQLNGHGQMNGHGQTNGRGAAQTNVFQQLMSTSQNIASDHSDSQGEMDVDMSGEKPELVSGQSFLDSHCRLVHSVPNGASHSKPFAALAAGRNTVLFLFVCLFVCFLR